MKYANINKQIDSRLQTAINGFAKSKEYDLETNIKHERIQKKLRELQHEVRRLYFEFEDLDRLTERKG